MRTYGQILLDHRPNGEPCWRIETEPHVRMKLRAVMGKVAKFSGTEILLSQSASNANDLQWFLSRYPMKLGPDVSIDELAQEHRETMGACEQIFVGDYQPRVFKLAIPARDYQARAVEVLLRRKRLFVGDDVGLGKTLIAIAAMTEHQTLPALVVTLTHLPRQWEEEIHKFAPGLTTHILKKTHPYELPVFFGRPPDVLICNYHKLGGWAHALAGKIKFCVFDECQELRRTESQKHQAGRLISEAAEYSLGTSATPIMNYGGEFWNLADVICPGQLGDHDEFVREWCTPIYGGKHKLNDPKAFGSYLRENWIMLRRSRKDVGRELPPVTHIPHTIDSDTRELHKIAGSAGELARIIVGQTMSSREQRFTAGGQFDMLMRQATGAAKAPYVADFVRMLVDSGEQVLLGGWHRICYDIWAEKLQDLKPVWYTGTESGNEKYRNAQDFIEGRSPIIMMSLRAGQGLEGLQRACRIAVLGELDWSPGVITQFIGRLARDDGIGNVVAYYLLAEEGSDPIMADVLGLKREQAEGVMNPDAPLMQRLEKGGDNIRMLAEAYLRRHAG